MVQTERHGALHPISGLSQPEIEAAFDQRDRHWTTAFRDWDFGTCLDLSIGYHNVLLGRLATNVIAIDDSFSTLQRLAGLAAAEGVTNLIPIHVTDGYPLSTDRFDSIVTRWPDSSLSLEEALTYLKHDGLFIVDFQASSSILHEIVSNPGDIASVGELWSSIINVFRRSFPTVNARLRREFESVTPLCNVGGTLFRLSDSTDVIRFFRESGRSMPFQEIIKAFDIAHVIRFVVPRFVMVCSNGTLQSDLLDDEVLLAGNHRSVSLSLFDEDRPIRKIPLGRGCAEYNRRELETVTKLCAQLDQREDLPEGRLEPSRFGPVLIEEAAQGNPLSLVVSGDSYQECFELGWDWLIRFQSETNPVIGHRSNEMVREDLSVESLGLSPPFVWAVDVPIGPVHGDFQPKNIFVDGETVTSVVDWEYAALQCPQIADAAQYVLRFGAVLFGGLQSGFDKTFRETSEYSEFVAAEIERYCDIANITPAQFKIYLPYPYIRFIRVHELNDSFSFYTDANYMTEIVEYIWDCWEDEQLLGAGFDERR